jgi:hypothetical protein
MLSVTNKRPLCWVSLCWVSLCWVSLCWVSLCWVSLCWVSLCWVSLCWVSLYWVSLGWVSWRNLNYFFNIILSLCQWQWLGSNPWPLVDELIVLRLCSCNWPTMFKLKFSLEKFFFRNSRKQRNGTSYGCFCTNDMTCRGNIMYIISSKGQYYKTSYQCE